MIESDKALLESLQQPECDGFNGYDTDQIKVAAAKRIEDLSTALQTEQEMHRAWRKRAEENEAVRTALEEIRMAWDFSHDVAAFSEKVQEILDSYAPNN